MTHSDPPKPLSKRALFRFHVVSLVKAGLLAGEKRADAVRRVAAQSHPTASSGSSRRVSERSLYRWMARFEAGGAEALEDASRKSDAASKVLKPDLLAFLEAQRGDDRAASIPELLRRAEAKGLLEAKEDVDRTTVYRALVRMGVPTGRTKQERGRDMRRFGYPHRMQMVLCDGKYFRAGEKRARRVAVFFLDDATRLGLDVVVGTSESAPLFLRGFYEVLRRHGRMGILYLDHGPGFIANAVAEVCRRLEIALIHGEAGYKEGRGKVERFNRTAKAAVLRNLDRRPDVDPALPALELRLRHWLFKTYNHTGHEAFKKVNGHRPTPYERWREDVRRLSHRTKAEINRAFVLYHERSVSRDRTVSIDGTVYELPLSLAPGGRRAPRIQIQERMLDETFHVISPGGEFMRIHPVDPAANARSRRARRKRATEEEATIPSPSAADLAFARDLGSVLGDEESSPEPPTPDDDSDDSDDHLPERTLR